MKEITCSVLGFDAYQLPFGFNEEEENCISFKNDLKNKLTALIENEHVTKFISGITPGTDMYASEIILELKKTYPFLSLESVISFEEEAVKWSESFRNRYFSVLQGCSVETVLQKHFSSDCLCKKNSYIINSSDIILSFTCKDSKHICISKNKDEFLLDNALWAE